VTDPVRLSTAGHLRWLLGFWRAQRGFLALLLFFTLVSSAVAVSYPLVLRDVIDSIGGPATHLDRVLLILGLIAFGRFVAGFYPGFRAWVNLRIENAVREKVFASVLSKDHTFFERFRTGDLVTRLTDDIGEYPRIAWWACSGVFRFLDSSAIFVFCVLMMLRLAPELALYAMAPVPITLWIFYLARKALGSTYRRQQELTSRTNNTIEAALAGIRIVKAFNAQEGQQRRLSAVLHERIGVQLKLAKLIALVHHMDNIAGRLGQVVVLSVGGLAVLDGELSMGTLFALYFYLDLLIHPMMDLPNLFVTARQAFVSIDREEEVLRHPAPARSTGGEDPGAIATVSAEQVDFHYGGDGEPALRELSFQVPAGRRVAVVGPVASGKTTLLRMLAGLARPRKGSYAVNGRAFSDWDEARLRPRIGYVPQDSHLFSDTIGENVSFGRDADEAWVRRCLEVAQMGPDLETMAKGTGTQLGRGGTLVSGGQKQRIAIARALAGRPELLLLDDCTASLDARNEDRFWAELDRSFPGVTTFVVSHRATTIRRADTILVLDRGRLVDRGTHAELTGRCEVYRDFLETEEKRTHIEEAFSRNE
jgi:ATP-binding cassette subfamily B protein